MITRTWNHKIRAGVWKLKNEIKTDTGIEVKITIETTYDNLKDQHNAF